MIVQEADELLYHYAAGGEKLCYIMEMSDGTIYDMKHHEDDSGLNKVTRAKIIKNRSLLGHEYGRDYKLYRYRQTHPLPFSIRNLKRQIEKLQAIDEDVLFCFSPTDGSNFRFKSAIRRPYKGDRKVCTQINRLNGTNYICGLKAPGHFDDNGNIINVCPEHGECEAKSEKPIHYNDLRNWLLENYNCKVMTGYEADDGLPIYGLPKGATSSHIDKDIDMVPGYHYNWRKEEFYKVTAEDALYNFCYQLLIGDSTDNIPPCLRSNDDGKVYKTGWGKKTAPTLIDISKGLDWNLEMILGKYKTAYGDKLGIEYMLECADLVFMCGAYTPGKIMKGSEIIKYYIGRLL